MLSVAYTHSNVMITISEKLCLHVSARLVAHHAVERTQEGSFGKLINQHKSVKYLGILID